MSLPAREPPPSADGSLPLRFDDSDRDLLARAFWSPGDGPRAWRLNGEAHRISLVDGFDRLLAWPVLHGVARYDHQVRTALRVLRDLRGRAILADEVGLGKTIEAGLVLKEDAVRGLIHRVLILTPAAFTDPWRGGRGERKTPPPPGPPAPPGCGPTARCLSSPYPSQTAAPPRCG